jgi:hypothetical protein
MKTNTRFFPSQRAFLRMLLLRDLRKSGDFQILLS